MEKTLYQQLIKGARTEALILFRIEDGSFGKKPFDICGVCQDGRAIAVEVKEVSSLDLNKPLPEHIFAEHQLKWLAVYQLSRALPLIVIHIKGGATYMFVYNGTKAKLQRPLREYTGGVLTRREGMFTGWTEAMTGSLESTLG